MPDILSTEQMLRVQSAVRFLREGRLVAFATETVYGLGGDAESDAAVAAIFAAKCRPHFNPLILHLGEASWAERYAVVPLAATRLMDEFWPGPLTLVLRRRDDAPSSLLASAGLDTVALRVPAHPLAQTLLTAFGHALAAPSANRSGRLSPTAASHVADEFVSGISSPSMILDGGECAIGVESTVVDLSEGSAVILRPGAITLEALREIEPEIRIADASGSVRAPGMLLSHYAPRLPLRLEATAPRAGEAFLAFGPTPHAHVLNLSERADPVEAAAHLFAFLRRLDDPASARAIAVMPIPEEGLGVAINDRLRRAAAPRDS